MSCVEVILMRKKYFGPLYEAVALCVCSMEEANGRI